MAGKFRLQQNSMLEIRGLSRGSMMDQVHEDVVPQSSSGMFYFDQSQLSHLQIDSDEDDDNSTITGGSGDDHRVNQRSPLHSDDTITASDTYWTGENSFGTGNTTERSSVYSWGDDEFDHQASRQVRLMFQAIEQMLFEGVLSGSTSLQHECREWMSSFPHLRILGKQIISPRDEGFQSVPSSLNPSLENSRSSSRTIDEGLVIKGYTMSMEPVPTHLLPQPEPDGGRRTSAPIPSPGSDLSHLYEEIIEQDGFVEEYLAYDIREMDDEENAKKYHVPRRRRLGFPPITPNACVKDAVLHQLFNNIWSDIVGCWSKTHPSSNTTLLKQILTQDALMGIEGDHSMSSKSVKSIHSRPGDKVGAFDAQRLNNAGIGPGQMFISYDPRGIDYDEDDYNGLHPGIDRMYGGPISHLMPSLSNPPRSLYPNDSMLPPSRGNYEPGRQASFATGRLSTAPHGNFGDMNSLNDLMKISQKKLQVRSDKVLTQSDELIPALGQDNRFGVLPSSSQFANGNSNNLGLGPVAHHLSTFTMGGAPSPFAMNNRPTTSRDNLPGAANRLSSATGRNKRFGKPGRLLPLDGAKTPKGNFDGYVKATKLTRPGSNAPASSSFGPLRANSPPHSFQPPPTAPNPSTSSSFWVNQRLPPIASGLESLHENSLLDVKKARGKTAHTRISSAIAEDKPVFKGLDFVSRPNTTHTFRADNLIPKRATSVTPSNLTFGAHGNSIPIGNLKSTSPSGAFFQNSPGSSTQYPHHSSYSPDHISGLAGITGKGINMVGVGQPSSPDEDPAPPQNSWGPSSQNISASQVRRKRPVLGLT
uniref:Protein FAM149B1 n=1 Tax=Phallusia mammillata TaxID=59560 RepID=A0A6F9DCJ9_9ASCI|nr:protein FAM149B1 [Phallusia mammillata]